MQRQHRRGMTDLKTLFYRNQLHDVARFIEQSNRAELGLDDLLTYSQALAELHRGEEAHAVLRQISQDRRENSRWQVQYANARVHYVENRNEQSLQEFRSLLDLASSHDQALRSTLGLLAAADSLSHRDLVESHLDFAMFAAETVSIDLKISFLLFVSALPWKFSRQERENFLATARLHSVSMGWTYFYLRVLLNLARLYGESDRRLGHHYILMIRQLATYEDAPHLAYLVNKMFPDQDPVFAVPFEICDTFRTIKVNGCSLSLRKQPLAFRLMTFLGVKRNWCTKAELATELWPNQIYHPVVHDPRIFNLVSRLRRVIEKNPNLNVVLIGDTDGYRLAINQCDLEKETRNGPDRIGEDGSFDVGPIPERYDGVGGRSHAAFGV